MRVMEKQLYIIDVGNQSYLSSVAPYGIATNRALADTFTKEEAKAQCLELDLEESSILYARK